jgi:hypothetical protein
MTQLHTEKPDLADVFRAHGHKLAFLLPEQRKAMNAVIACRTAVLGGHVLKCDACGSLEISYNSCRNRHCPKCQSLAKAKWIMAREEELLPVPYFHIVFTFSDLLYPIAFQNKKVVYDILFQASSETLKEVAANPKNLGADIGFISILHTWDQRLNHHPHIHCIVPGGGLARDKTRWIASAANFFLSVKILSAVFRAKFLSRLEEVFRRNTLVFHGQTAGLADRKAFQNLLLQSCATNWVVYCKRPFAGPKQVLEYLGRYTHRVAISNNRILSMTETTVTFQWRDRKNGGVAKEMTLDAVEFLRRFLLHVLPSGFMKIRHYGFLGNPAKKEAIALCRSLAKDKSVSLQPHAAPRGWRDLLLFLTGKDLSVCPQCGKGHLFVLEELPKRASPPLEKTG